MVELTIRVLCFPPCQALKLKSEGRGFRILPGPTLVTETNELFPPCALNFRANHYLKQIITFCLHENGTFTYIMCQFSFRSLGSYRRLQLFVPRRIQREAVLPRLCAWRVQKWWHVR